ncbi:serine/threonine protein kinase [bacterium]|nr:serine/threonine protein kinase [bacterium]
MDKDAIVQLLESSGRKTSPKMRIFEDTSNFSRIDSNDVMVLDGSPYLVLRNEIERGFGMDDDPKFWVKRVVGLNDGKKKIIKLVFYERFEQKIGDVSVEFFRSPIKEAKVLDAVAGNPFFMQGTSVNDVMENNVRIIDYINGTPLNAYLAKSTSDHKTYFENELPKFLSNLLDCMESLGFLHEKGFVHGDVRWDHIFWDRDNLDFRWIDFDYNYDFPQNPYGADLFGLGKILTSVFGRRKFLYYDLKTDPQFTHVLNDLYQEDFSLLDQNRFINIKKMYPYIPDELNNIFLNFSGYASNFYLSVDELFDDLRKALKVVYGS